MVTAFCVDSLRTISVQLSVGTLYLTSKIIIVPCGLLVKRRNVCPEEIDAALLVHVFWHGYMPLYVSHVLRILRIVSYIVNDVVL